MSLDYTPLEKAILRHLRTVTPQSPETDYAEFGKNLELTGVIFEQAELELTLLMMSLEGLILIDRSWDGNVKKINITKEGLIALRSIGLI